MTENKYINAEKFYADAVKWESEALTVLANLDPNADYTEYAKWSVILNERTSFKHDIIDAPKVDVEEVRHGKWEHGCEIRREYIGDALVAIYYDKWWCSQCHYTIDDHHYSKITYKRCPECGAHMDKEKEE